MRFSGTYMLNGPELRCRSRSGKKSMLDWIWSETMSLPNLCPVSFSDPLGCHTQDGLSKGDPTACYAPWRHESDADRTTGI